MALSSFLNRAMTRKTLWYVLTYHIAMRLSNNPPELAHAQENYHIRMYLSGRFRGPDVA